MRKIVLLSICLFVVMVFTMVYVHKTAEAIPAYDNSYTEDCFFF